MRAIFLVVMLLLLSSTFLANELAEGKSVSVSLKPLEIKGPAFAEVNETISFFVASEGMHPGATRWGDIEVNIVDWNSFDLPPKLSKDFYPNNLTREIFLTKLPEAIRKSGRISGNETWKGVILVTGDLTIDKGASVIVEPGTIVFVAARSDDQKSGRPSPPDQFNPKDPVKNEEYVKNRVEINVFGAFVARGTDDLPIIITSSARDPQSDDWMGITVHKDGALEFERVLMEYFRVFGISSGKVRISKSILRNMMESVVIMGSVNELLTINPIITENYIYNSGHFTITVRSGSPTITHNVIYARYDMNFPGFEYGAISVDFFAKPVIEYNFIEGGSPLRYEAYDIWGRYIRFINGSGLHLHAYFGAIVRYNTFFNCSNTAMEITPYQWIIEKNNFIYNTVNIKLFENWKPEPSDIWQQKLLENLTVIPLSSVSLINNYWGTCDEDEITNSIVVFRAPQSTLHINFKPFAKSFIQDALPQWRRFMWKGIRDRSSIILSISANSTEVRKSINVTGFIYPAHANAAVTLSYKMPNGTILNRNITSTSLGEFEDVFVPEIAGNWTVKAIWSGDSDHRGAESPEIPFTVLRAKSSLTLSISRENLSKGEQIMITGLISPPLARVTITLTLKSPSNITFNVSCLTDIKGSFSYTFAPNETGKWSILASWSGNENFEGNLSPLISFTVEEKAVLELYVVAITIIAISVVALIYKSVKRKLLRQANRKSA